MKLNGSITIETTRRCNFKCGHCLRGEAQDVDMDPQYIKDLLCQFDHDIKSVCFTGGEPSLNYQPVVEFTRLCKHFDLTVREFSLTTNGTCASDEFITAVSDLWRLCDCVGRLVISDDIYHEREQGEEVFMSESIKRLKGLPFTVMSSTIFHQKDSIKDFMKQGNAENFGERIIKEESFECFDSVDLNHFGKYGEVELSLNCEGKIILGNNWSYQHQDKYVLCDVQDSIFDALKSRLV